MRLGFLDDFTVVLYCSIKTDTGDRVMMNTKRVPDLFVLMMARFLMEAAWIAGCPITLDLSIEYVLG